MNFFVEDLFSSPIFSADFSGSMGLARKACVDIESRAVTQPYAITNGGITTFPIDSVFQSDEYAPLRDHIIELVTHVAEKQGIDMSKHHVWLSELWVNKMNTGSEHKIHSHAPSAYSGCVYVECPEGSAPTRFFNPIYNLALTCPLPVFMKSNCESIDIPPQEGSIVIWNGWLAHNVPPNNSKTPRLTISFNTLVKENR